MRHGITAANGMSWQHPEIIATLAPKRQNSTAIPCDKRPGA